MWVFASSVNKFKAKLESCQVYFMTKIESYEVYLMMKSESHEVL